MIEPFSRKNTDTIVAMQERIASFRKILSSWLDGQYSSEDIILFLKLLIEHQDGKGFWGGGGVIELEGAPSDARVDFIFMPTYILTALLMNIKLRTSDVSAMLPGFDTALRKGLEASTMRKLEGHGYEALDGRLEALEVFSQAGLGAFLEAYPDFCTKFSTLIRSLFDEFNQALAKGPVKNAWGTDYTSDIRRAISDYEDSKRM